MASMKLVFEKGPRNGEIRTYKPRSKVRIGRVVRGNNLTIKDDAISSNHLTIEFDSGSGKWVITDLDSSNGTHLNSSKLKPFSPFQLSNADEIKIGDSTSIRVEIVGEICDASKKPKVVMVDEEYPDVVEGGSVRVHKEETVKKGVDSAVNLGIGHRNGRGRGRPKKESDGVILNVEEDAKPEQEQRMATRSTRNSKKATDEILCLEKVMQVRRTRRIVKNVENEPENDSLDVGDYRQVDNNVSIADSRKTRGGRGRKKKIELENLAQLEVTHVTEEPIGDTEKVVEEGGEAMVQDTLLEDMMNKEVSESIMGDMAGENDNDAIASHFEQDTSEKLEEDNRASASHFEQDAPERLENDNRGSASHFEEDVPERVENDMVLGGGEVEKTGAEEIDEVLDDTEVDKGEKEDKFETLPDLEKMTLGDWFDYLKVSLPKQIYDARDEVISDMRKTTERVREYMVMVQQQNEKGKARTELHMS